jgi:hypothetical protein
MRIFPKQTKSQTLIEHYLFRENRTIRNPKPEHPNFVTLSLRLNFLVSWSLDSLLPFSMLKTPLDLQIFEFSSFLNLTLKLPKLDCLELETGSSGFLSLAKFGHQHMPLAFRLSLHIKRHFDQIKPEDDVHGVPSAIFVLRAIFLLSAIF